MTDLRGGTFFGKRFPGTGDAKDFSLSAQGHMKWKIKFQKTPRDGAEHREGDAGAQGTGGKNNRMPNTWERPRTGPPVEASRWGKGRVDYRDR